MTTLIKICGLTRVQDALAAAYGGAHAIGVVLYPSSPRFVEHGQARRIVDALPPFVTPVALMVDPSTAEVEKIIDEVKPALLQFHGDEPADFCSSFSLPYIKAVRVRPEVDLLQYARLHAGAKRPVTGCVCRRHPGGHRRYFRLGIDSVRIAATLYSRGWVESTECDRGDPASTSVGR